MSKTSSSLRCWTAWKEYFSHESSSLCSVVGSSTSASSISEFISTAAAAAAAAAAVVVFDFSGGWKRQIYEFRYLAHQIYFCSVSFVEKQPFC